MDKDDIARETCRLKVHPKPQSRLRWAESRKRDVVYSPSAGTGRASVSREARSGSASAFAAALTPARTSARCLHQDRLHEGDAISFRHGRVHAIGRTRHSMIVGEYSRTRDTAYRSSLQRPGWTASQPSCTSASMASDVWERHRSTPVGASLGRDLSLGPEYFHDLAAGQSPHDGERTVRRR